MKMLRASGLVPAHVLDPLAAAFFDEPGSGVETLVENLVGQDLLTEWQVAQLRKGRSKGFLLGKYALRRPIGAGGMGSVYLARHATLGGDVAIKVLPTKRVADGSYLERFRREAQAAGRLSHPNIARVIDLDSAADGRIHFMVMEYVDGIDLHARVKQEGPLDAAAAADCIRQAALGLHYAHEHGFVHRDIKPANLMLDVHGTIKVLDLGLAKTHADDDEAASLTMEFREKTLGTADFVAPEQATDSHTADRRADLYSLGCTLYYLLVGSAPFAAGSIKDRLRAQVHTKPPNLLEKRPDVPADLAELYFQLMQKDPAARPQTAQLVADALQAWMAKHGAKSAPGGPVHRPTVARRASQGSSVIRRPAVATPYRSGPASTPGSSIDSMIVGQSSVIHRSGGAPRTPPGPPQRGTLPSTGSARPALPPAVRSPAPGPPPPIPQYRTPPPQARLDWATSLRGLASRNLAGLPLGLWAVIAGGVVAMVILATLVLIRS
jgi:serine/threonine protein kinase